MWQTLVILLVLLGVAIYLVRHYVRVYRAEAPTCAGCSGCCGSAASEKPVFGPEGFVPGCEGCDETSPRRMDHR